MSYFPSERKTEEEIWASFVHYLRLYGHKDDPEPKRVWFQNYFAPYIESLPGNKTLSDLFRELPDKLAKAELDWNDEMDFSKNWEDWSLEYRRKAKEEYNELMGFNDSIWGLNPFTVIAICFLVILLIAWWYL